MVDEIYDNCNLNDLFEQIKDVTFYNQLFCAIINGSDLIELRNVETDGNFSYFYFPATFPEERISLFSVNGVTHRVYLRNLYRNPLQISKLCTKVRRQLDYCSDEAGSIFSLPWAMSVDNGLNVHNRRQSISFVSHQKFNFINEEFLQGKTIAIVVIERQEDFIIYFCNMLVHLFHIDKLEDSNVTELEFTGVEFDVVYISFNIIGHDINRIEKTRLILYNAMSRAKDSVIILFHENDWALFSEFQKYKEMDLALDKLSKSQLLNEIELTSIDSQSKVMQAIKTIIVSKHRQQFGAILPVLRKFKDANFYHCVQKLLASSFTWCKKGNILKMLHRFQSETKTEMTQEDAWKYLCQASFFVAGDWNQTLRREFFNKFQKVTEVSFQNFEMKIEDVPYALCCWIGECEDLLLSFGNAAHSKLLFHLIMYMGQFDFNENCFRNIITTLIGGKEISIDFGSEWRNIFLLAKSREENFGTIIDLMEIDAVQVFTEIVVGPSDFHPSFLCFQKSSFGLFKTIVMKIRQAKIRLSDLLNTKMRSFLWYIDWGDYGIKKTHLVLQDAFEQNNGELEKLLTQRDKQGVTVLYFKCTHSKDPRIVQLFIKYAKTIWDKEILENGETLIHYASIGNQIAVLDFLLEMNKEKNYEVTKKVNKEGRTCLHLAGMQGNTTIVKMLLNTVPELALKTDNFKQNALHSACINGHLDTAQTLYNRCCEKELFHIAHDIKNVRNKRFPSAAKSENLKRIQNESERGLLKENRVAPDTTTELMLSENKTRALHSSNANLAVKNKPIRRFHNPGENSQKFSTSNSRLKQTKVIPEKHSDFLLSIDENGNSILHLAAASGNIDLVKWVISLDAKFIYGLNNLKQNVLHVACVSGNLVATEWLLKQQPDFLWSVDESGDSILHLAAVSGNIDLVKWVIS